MVITDSCLEQLDNVAAAGRRLRRTRDAYRAWEAEVERRRAEYHREIAEAEARLEQALEALPEGCPE